MNKKSAINAEAIRKYSMIIILVLVVVLFNVLTGGKMLLPQNVSNLIAQNAYVFVLATGMLFCILTGGNIDLAVGSVVCFVGAIGGKLMVEMGMNPILALLIMLLIGIISGIAQAIWIGFVRIPPFIVTLAGMLAFRGLSNVILNGMTLAPMPDLFVSLFNDYVPDVIPMAGEYHTTCMIVGVIVVVLYVVFSISTRIKRVKQHYTIDSMPVFIAKIVIISAAILFFMNSLAMYKGIPNVLIWIAAVILIYAYIASQTTFGRHFYAVGGNEKASKLSGINTNMVYFLAYVNMGLLAGLAGIMTVARLNSANPTAGTNYEMDAIAACYIGGASAFGGVGTVPGVIIGALLMGVLNLGMSILGVDQNMQKVVKGLVLLVAVIFDVVSKRKSLFVK